MTRERALKMTGEVMCASKAIIVAGVYDGAVVMAYVIHPRINTRNGLDAAMRLIDAIKAVEVPHED